ncbi:MAG: WG repeat-containing protein [Pseudomonadota bacterium]
MNRHRAFDQITSLLIALPALITFVLFGSRVALAEPVKWCMQGCAPARCGLLSVAGEWLVPPRYGLLAQWPGDYLLVGQSGRWSVIDHTGRTVIPPRKRIFRHKEEGLFAVLTDDDKEGIMQADGKWLLRPVYDAVSYRFSRGTAWAIVDGRYGMLDRAGEWLIRPRFEHLSHFHENGSAAAKLGGRYGFVDRKGRWRIKPKFDGFRWVNAFAEQGYAAVSQNGRWGMIDQQGAWIVTPRYRQFIQFQKEQPISARTDEGWWVLDRRGKPLLSTALDKPALFSRNGQGVGKVAGKSGLFDAAGTWLIAPEYHFIAQRLRMGLRGASRDGKSYGFLDEAGRWAIEPRFSEVRGFTNAGAAFVKSGPYWGAIGPDGAWIMRPQLEEAPSASRHGPAAARRDGKWGFVSRSGRWAVKPRYDWVSGFSAAGIARVRDAENYAGIDQGGALITALYTKVDLCLRARAALKLERK